MKIEEKNGFFEVIPETIKDCNFIDYIESASGILVGGKTLSVIGEFYRITKVRIMNLI